MLRKKTIHVSKLLYCNILTHVGEVFVSFSRSRYDKEVRAITERLIPGNKYLYAEFRLVLVDEVMFSPKLQWSRQVDLQLPHCLWYDIVCRPSVRQQLLISPVTKYPYP